MKVIIIPKCDECPYFGFDYDYDDDYWCSNNTVKVGQPITLKAPFTIPNWCPIESLENKYQRLNKELIKVSDAIDFLKKSGT